MRMKMFAAESIEAAKAKIFAEMGSDAVILSEREVDGGVEVRAAIDRMGAAAVGNEPVFLRDARAGATKAQELRLGKGTSIHIRFPHQEKKGESKK